MYIFLILFFASLAGIIFMIGRKLISPEIGEIQGDIENPLSQVFDSREIKRSFIRNAKRTEHVILFVIIRFYVLSSNFLKKKIKKVLEALKNRRVRKNKLSGNPVEKREASNFLKLISDYKSKIRKIKHRIKEEEGIK